MKELDALKKRVADAKFTENRHEEYSANKDLAHLRKEIRKASMVGFVNEMWGKSFDDFNQFWEKYQLNGQTRQLYFRQFIRDLTSSDGRYKLRKGRMIVSEEPVPNIPVLDIP